MTTAGAAPAAAARRKGGSASDAASVPRPQDFAAIEEFLQSLARAVRQFHTYPPTSQLCTDVIAACHKALAALQRDRLSFLITPHELILDEIGLGQGTIVEHELVRRLHRAHVAALDIDRVALPRDFSRFCSDLIRSDDLAHTKANFAELLAEHGVDAIVPRMAHRPEVLAVGAPRAPLRDLVEHERRRRQSALAPGVPVNYLYPPEKGWVRLDPAARFDTISLLDLAVLVEDPTDLATMLLRLTDDEPVDAQARSAALDQKFTDVATLFASLDARLARVMFGRLSRAVLELEPERRTQLLKRTILPGLLDGRADGMVLRDFPDADLADSLCLLLDLETAAPELLDAALNRLDLPVERRDAVGPLIEARLRATNGSEGTADGRGKSSNLDRYARELVRVEPASGKSFADFAAFDLSIDERAAAAIASTGDTIGATDLPVTQLQCIWRLVRLEPNPNTSDALLRRVVPLFAELERSARWPDLARSVAEFRQLSSDLRETRPDVADGILAALVAFCGPDRALTLAELYGRDAEGRRLAGEAIEAFGTVIVPGAIAALDDPAFQVRARSLVPLMCDHAGQLAPALASAIDRAGIIATRAIVRVLGFAGAGYEPTLAHQLDHRDEQTAREALRALARIGTARAAHVVALRIQNGSPKVRLAAEDALWQFSPAQIAAQLRELFGSREFVLRHTDAAGRLLDRAAQAGTEGLDHVLAQLESMRFHLWKPTLVRVARKARRMRAPAARASANARARASGSLEPLRGTKTPSNSGGGGVPAPMSEGGPREQ